MMMMSRRRCVSKVIVSGAKRSLLSFSLPRQLSSSNKAAQRNYCGGQVVNNLAAGEGEGEGVDVTPLVNYTSAQLQDFKENGHLGYDYKRYGYPPMTTTAELKFSFLERAKSTLLIDSSMCATTVMMMALIPSGGHIITTTDCYRKIRNIIQTTLPQTGITTTVIDPADYDALESALDSNKVSLFFTESPTNLFLRCVDIELVSKMCHAKGAIVCIDGTFATPINQNVLKLGADIVLHSSTKYIAGCYDDALGGCVSGSKEIISIVRNLHRILGGVFNREAACLLVDCLDYLNVAVKKQNETAQRMAEVLEAHPKVKRVYYPGLQSHPDHHIAKKQMIGGYGGRLSFEVDGDLVTTGYGGFVSFEVDGDLATTSKFIDSLKIPYMASSFGDGESIVDQTTIMSYRDVSQSDRAEYGITDNLVRFSFGYEDYEDLEADVLQALEKIET